MRGSVLVRLEQRALESSPRRGDLLGWGQLPTSMPVTVRRVNDLPRAVGLRQQVLAAPHHRRRFPRHHVRVHAAHVRVHQVVVVVDVRVGIVLDEIEALLPAAVLHRLAELVEAQVSRTVHHASVRQIRAVVVLVELTPRVPLLLRLRTKKSSDV